MDEFHFMHTLKLVPNSLGWYTFTHYPKESELVCFNLDSANRWKDSFIFVGVCYWKHFTEEDNLIPVRRFFAVAGRISLTFLIMFLVFVPFLVPFSLLS